MKNVEHYKTQKSLFSYIKMSREYLTFGNMMDKLI